MEIKVIPPEATVVELQEQPMGQASPGACYCPAGCIPEFDPLNPNTVISDSNLYKVGLKTRTMVIIERIEGSKELQKVKSGAQRQAEHRARLKALGIEQLNQRVPKSAHEQMTKIADVLTKEVMAGKSVEDALRKAVQPFAASAPAPQVVPAQPISVQPEPLRTTQAGMPGQPVQGIQSVADTDTSQSKSEAAELMCKLEVANGEIEHLQPLAQVGEKVQAIKGWRRFILRLAGIITSLF